MCDEDCMSQGSRRVDSKDGCSHDSTAACIRVDTIPPFDPKIAASSKALIALQNIWDMGTSNPSSTFSPQPDS
jgi:hypothetical protein